jgi:hypothetical protein
MNILIFIRKIFGISDKQIDFYAPIYAAVILARGSCGVTERSTMLLRNDAKKLFTSKTRQGVFVNQVEFFLEGGYKAERDLNGLVKLIERNAQLYPKLMKKLKLEYLDHYRNDTDIQKRMFEFLGYLIK